MVYLKLCQGQRIEINDTQDVRFLICICLRSKIEEITQMSHRVSALDFLECFWKKRFFGAFCFVFCFFVCLFCGLGGCLFVCIKQHSCQTTAEYPQSEKWERERRLYSCSYSAYKQKHYKQAFFWTCNP